MPVGYNLFCQKFANMADTLYHSYLVQNDAYEKTAHENIPIENKEGIILAYSIFDQLQADAISAIIFQALAIEAYINLFGVYELGEEVFFSEYEPPKNKKPAKFHYKSSIEKLTSICKEVYHVDYPSSEIAMIEALFNKRDRLVHNKPRPHILEKPSIKSHTLPDNDSFESYVEEETFIFDKIDMDMEQYKQLQKTIKNIRSAEYELVEEITTRLVNDTIGETANILYSSMLRNEGEM